MNVARAILKPMIGGKGWNPTERRQKLSKVTSISKPVKSNSANLCFSGWSLWKPIILFSTDKISFETNTTCAAVTLWKSKSDGYTCILTHMKFLTIALAITTFKQKAFSGLEVFA